MLSPEVCWPEYRITFPPARFSCQPAKGSVLDIRSIARHCRQSPWLVGTVSLGVLRTPSRYAVQQTGLNARWKPHNGLNRVIISDRHTWISRTLGAAAAGAGIVAWIIYFQAGLVLSHYDARAHLVVSRRVLDNITPGWQQVGAVWLPLPHLLQILPAQVDVLYRTGAAASAISIASFGIAAYAMARLIIAVTGSATGAVAAVAMLALNPNLLYLQTTPMTEPLLLAVSWHVILWLFVWVLEDRDEVPRRLGWALVAATLTRYEAWCIVGAALAAVVYAMWRRGTPAARLSRRALRLAVWPAAAVSAFLINSRITIGRWFVTEGFFVPDPTYQGQAWSTLVSLWWGTHELSGYVVEIVALGVAAILCARLFIRRDDAALLIPVALLAAATLPMTAFLDGHPYRIRYMTPLVAASVTLNGIGIGLARRAAPFVAAVLVASALVESPPWNVRAPMILEAQVDHSNSEGRRHVTACLKAEYRGEKILASMGSLAHYMQELSSAGFTIADFVNEGNGTIWDLALETGPAPHAGWMLAEEQAEGGDLLAKQIRGKPAFAARMLPVCEGGGVRLYKRIGDAPRRTAE